ncbi:hypothetical protein [Glycomyces sp. NPDC048151]|uniref:hypothetical protein n=1 Tax=Glycomyces sp. NPDC048151 TaxID=3364002 RepID=UPI00371E930F
MDRSPDYYYTEYDQEQLWHMLMRDGDPWSVRQSGQFWKHARESVELVAAAFARQLDELADYWQGRAADRYQAWAAAILDAFDAAREGMSYSEKHLLAEAAAALEAAQDDALAAGLDPSHWADLDRWVEDHWTPLGGLTELQLRAAHAAFRDEQRHRLAEVVSALGERYRALQADIDDAMPDVPDLPGADTYEPLRGTALDRPLGAVQPAPEPPPAPEPELPEPDEAPPVALMSYDDIDRPLPAPRVPAQPDGLFGKAPTATEEVRAWNYPAMLAAAELGRSLARQKGARPAEH